MISEPLSSSFQRCATTPRGGGRASHRLLYAAVYIRQFAAGVWTFFLPSRLAGAPEGPSRSLREEMNAICGQEC